MTSKFDLRAPKRLLDAADELVSRDEAQRIIESAVKLSKADAVQVNLGGGRQRNVRFAANQMSTAGIITDLSLVVTSSFGPKHAVTTTNDLSPEGIERAVRSSEAIARLAPNDPEAMPNLPQQQVAPVTAAWDEATVNLDAGACAKAALTALGPARATGNLQAAGFLRDQHGAVEELHLGDAPHRTLEHEAVCAEHPAPARLGFLGNRIETLGDDLRDVCAGLG